MNHDRLEPLFQPIFDKAGQVFAYEALLRLKGQPFSPARLVQRLEQSGYIVPLDLAMVRRIGEILAMNGTRPRIAINVSIVTVQTAGDDYVRALAAIAPLARLLIVELTETMPVTDQAALQRFYAACRAHGFAIALDDCRPGHLYGTPEFIASLQPQFVKLDGVYLQARYADGQLAGLDQMIQAAHAGSAPVIAEFISSQALREFAFHIGADYAQGFELGMPAPLPAAEEGVYTHPFSNLTPQDQP